MKNKILTSLAAALMSVVLLLSLSSCGSMGGNGEEPTDAPAKDDIKEDVSDIGDDLKDGADDIGNDIKNGANDIKNGIEDILPDAERGKQTGDDAFTSDEKDYSHNGGMNVGK